MKNPLPYPLFLAIILFYSCSKSSTEQSVQPIKPPVTPAADQTPDVYATGAVYRGLSIAAYWKNDSIVEMTQSPVIGEGLDIAVSGRDVYVCGYYRGSGDLQACYEKNAQMVDLSQGYSFDLAKAIAINGQDVYSAGYGLNANN